MGLKVTAAQAAALAHVSERTIRTWLQAEPGKEPKLKAEKVQQAGRPAAWAIDVDDLRAVPGVEIDSARLAELTAQQDRTPQGILARLAAMETELAALRARMRALESSQNANTLSNVLRGDSDGFTPSQVVGDVLGASVVPASQPARTDYALRYAAPSAPGTFATRADAARWLMRHGINAEGTPKSWPGWRSVRLEPEDVLRMAISVYDPSNWRITWRLHRCEDAGCVCQALLSN